jgi:Phage integrase, N-terminal SAM-like domain
VAIYKKSNSKVYYTKFEFKGKEIRKSTGFTNKKEARAVEAKLRTELKEGRWGILEEKQAEVTLSEFLIKHFVTGEIKPKTREYYQYGIDKLLESDLAHIPLQKITKQDSQRFVAKHVRPASDFTSKARAKHLANGKFSPSSVNCVLRTLKRALSVAHESGYLPNKPEVELAKNERHRERVISEAEQQAYFKNAVQPLP